MHFTKLSIVYLATLASQFQHASAECCPCTSVTLLGQLVCDDRTICKPYCGHGECDLFGCNCAGGCRVAKHAESFARTSLTTDDVSEDYFNSADANNDGRLTFEEWVAIDVNQGVNKDALAVHWAKFDRAGAGYLTKAEAISRTA